jgi:hypothetical protein
VSCLGSFSREEENKTEPIAALLTDIDNRARTENRDLRLRRR